MAHDPTSRFAALVVGAGDDLPLDEAALLIAAHAMPGLDVEDERARLDHLASGVPHPTAEGLIDHLVHDLGFEGDHVTYHEARNSLIPQVLDRRRGIPLSLAVIAMELGRRCGVPLVGVGMPGHFLLRPAHDTDRFLDVFSGGTRLDRSQCRAIFEQLHPGAAWDDAFLEPVRPQAILVRMLANLGTAYRRAGDRRALCWTVALRLVLPGATDRDRRELAVLLDAAGRYSEAADVLDAVGEPRDQQAAARLRARLN